MSVTFRSADGDDLEALLAFSTDEPVSWIGADRYRAESATRNYRPEWSWLALRDGRPVGRALWWGSAGAEAPSTLDDLLVAPGPSDDERTAIAAGLIAAGAAAFGSLPEWIVDVAVDWHADEAAVAAVGWRAGAARAAGLGRMTERVSVALEAPSGHAQPVSTPALRFRGGDDEEFEDLFAGVAVGSLDAHTLAAVAELGSRGAAADDLAFYRSLPGSRDGWRVALDADGLVVGFVIATRTAYDAAISSIGVLPQHRGRGVVDGLLAEGVRVHAEAGAPRVVGTTDATNTPMRRAFERAGFVVTKRRIVFEH
ncbi:GNAT family N-acetyltransferase [Curtobacterium sp. A7_M15]|uniref:GNAT family N-acetyltransferase n=1 Tax=Curtobacterium sp. A7_M15 TaxID=3065241 RepID=UPI002737968D|nr:GNAT family N-acetyltransferase [Curtobacterium sp. A7_M15]MDP4334224.1 GNAT family N-acetyltransferase [Curtobacterium sp. A7_M15]